MSIDAFIISGNQSLLHIHTSQADDYEDDIYHNDDDDQYDNDCIFNSSLQGTIPKAMLLIGYFFVFHRHIVRLRERVSMIRAKGVEIRTKRTRAHFSGLAMVPIALNDVKNEVPRIRHVISQSPDSPVQSVGACPPDRERKLDCTILVCAPFSPRSPYMHD